MREHMPIGGDEWDLVPKRHMVMTASIW
jgi:hypothetical protein